MSEDAGRKIMAELKKLAKNDEDLGLNDYRMIVALERAVARVESDSELAKNLIFKGGFVLLKSANSTRFTRDIDALAKEIDQEQVIERVNNALGLDLKDGLWYGDLRTRDLGRELPYPGIRFDAAFQIGDPPKEEKKNKKAIANTSGRRFWGLCPFF